MGAQGSKEKQQYATTALDRNAPIPAAQGGGGGAGHRDPTKFHSFLEDDEKVAFAENADKYLSFFLPTATARNGVYKQKLTDLILNIDTATSVCLSGARGETLPDDCVPLISMALTRCPRLQTIHLDNVNITVLGLRTLAMWLPRGVALQTVTLRGNGLAQPDCRSFLKDLVELSTWDRLPRTLRTIDMTSNPVWSTNAEVNGEMLSDLEFLAGRSQLTVYTDPAPERPFDVYGVPMQLSQFSGPPSALSAVVQTPAMGEIGLVSNEFDFSGKQDAERKVDDMKRLCDILVNVQAKPLAEQRGEQFLARVFYCEKRGSKKLVLVTEDYERKIMRDKTMVELPRFLEAQQTARVKYPAANILDIAIQMGRLCEFLHSQDMILTRVLPGYVALDEKKGDIRYMELHTLRAESGISAPAAFQHKCEDPALARIGTRNNLNKSLDIYALGMFTLFVLCFAPDFKARLFKFPAVTDQAGADRLKASAVAAFDKQLRQSIAGGDAKPELFPVCTQLAELVAECMQTEYNTKEIRVQRPDVRDFLVRLEAIRASLK